MPNKANTGLLDAVVATSRRGFLTRGAALLSSLALGASDGFAEALCPANNGIKDNGGEFVDIKEIGAVNNVLTAIVRVDDEAKAVWLASPNSKDPTGFPAPVCAENQQMRYFAGSGADGKQVWPKQPGFPSPGPTLRARVGDQVHITFLNHVDLKHFPKTLDQAEQGITKGCDVSTTLALQPDGSPTQRQIYPGPTYNVTTGQPAGAESEPDCFHGSSSANLHFHGFHVTPGTTGDNVLVQIRPSPRDPAGKPVVTAESVKAAFKEVFDKEAAGHGPRQWRDLPSSYTATQKRLLQAYDRTLPPGMGKLWPENEKSIEQGLWPQYYIGAYPYAFRIQEFAKPAAPAGTKAMMGQAPGTHWYHSHKHGSTALNSLNGMSGAFVIEGEFDDQLSAYYGELEEKVLVLQQFAPSLNLVSAPKQGGAGTTTPALIFINGRHEPILPMKPGQTQRWRIVNACSQAQVRLNGIVAGTGSGQVQWRQIAQDGVQLKYENYNKPDPLPAIAPGNRVDLLVQAPTQPGTYVVHSTQFPFPGAASVTTLMTINVVAGTPVNSKPFPAGEAPQGNYPKMPDWLDTIKDEDIHIRRTLVFGTSPKIGRGTGFGPTHSINGKQFNNDEIDEIMALNSVEEWTLENSAGTVQHPFHIHVNPFQVVEVFDPSVDQAPAVLKPPYVWWDVIAIPAAANGKNGYVKIRTRFADFVGLFVLHCHILAHEDRGMMQLVEVVNSTTTQKHYH